MKLECIKYNFKKKQERTMDTKSFTESMTQTEIINRGVNALSLSTPSNMPLEQKQKI